MINKFLAVGICSLLFLLGIYLFERLDKK